MSADTVHMLRMTQVDGFQGGAQRVLPVGQQDQMHMVCHQAIRENVHPLPAAVRLKQVQINMPVPVREEDVLPAVSPLGHMMRRIRNNDSGNTWHEIIRAQDMA